MKFIRKTFSLLLVFWACLFFSGRASAQDSNNNYGIVPRPKSITSQAGSSPFRINSETKIIFNGKEAKQIANYLSEKLAQATGYGTRAEKGKRAKKNTIRLAVDNSGKGKAEAYRLESSANGVSITGNSSTGLFYGVQTLLQLLPPEIYSDKKQQAQWTVPAVKIEDEPFFEKIRGLHVDISRHFRNKEEMFKTIDYVAYHKLNTLHIHLTDDQGWRIEIKAFPKLTEIGAIGDHSTPGKGKKQFYTQKEMREIIAYAKARHIDIIPEIDMPGHMQATIRAYPELKSPTDKREPAKVIRIDEKGEEFCKKVLDEINDLFTPEYIHIGFDEINFGSKKKIYGNEEITAFAGKLAEYVKTDLKATPIVWDDAFEKGWHDKQTLVHWWRYGKVHWWKDLPLTIDQKVQKLDQPYLLSPANKTYFDMRNAKGEAGAGWAGIASIDKLYVWEPLLDLTDADPSKNHLAQGVIACTWSEQIKTWDDFQDRTFPRLAALSEKGWAQPKNIDLNKPNWKTWRDEVLIKKQLKRYQFMGIKYWSHNSPEKLLKLAPEKKAK
ncbi:hypothetical protein FUAX_25640 [Fulvitalea axinellae]|uniref:beta-N-acetylhexosaminidase n=1 Tax=Fulvitalea axinellae TaxID=1182444 RepID=A0AAU9CXF6_9BACT|nr:hypothetical protein FUAX_25640 [Fulvitalea axinellae]